MADTHLFRGRVRGEMNKEHDRPTPQESISIEFRAKGTVAILTDIIAGFASKSGFSIGFRPGDRPDYSVRSADMRMSGPISKTDTLSPRKEHEIGRINLQQLPDDICLISMESKGPLDQAEEFEAFHVALYDHLKGLGLYMPPLSAQRSA